MELSTAIQVIDALGGTAATAELIGSKYNAVWNWRKFDRFPPKFYLVMTAALEQRGYRAPASLWGMPELERAS